MKEIRERRKIIVEKQDNFGYEIEKEILAMNGELKKRKRSKLQQKMINNQGKIQLDPDEANLLELEPDFAILEDIDRDLIKAEFLTALTKIRWANMDKDLEEIRKYREITNVEEEEKIWMISNMDRRVVDIDR